MTKIQKKYLIHFGFDGFMIGLGATLSILLFHVGYARFFGIISCIAISSGVWSAWRESLYMQRPATLPVSISHSFGVLLPALPFLLFHGWIAVVILIIELLFVSNLVGAQRGTDPALTYEIYIAVATAIIATFIAIYAVGGFSGV